MSSATDPLDTPHSDSDSERTLTASLPDYGDSQHTKFGPLHVLRLRPLHYFERLSCCFFALFPHHFLVDGLQRKRFWRALLSIAPERERVARPSGAEKVTVLSVCCEASSDNAERAHFRRLHQEARGKGEKARRTRQEAGLNGTVLEKLCLGDARVRYGCLDLRVRIRDLFCERVSEHEVCKFRLLIAGVSSAAKPTNKHGVGRSERSKHTRKAIGNLHEMHEEATV